MTDVAAGAGAGLDADIRWLTELITRRYAPEGIPIERVDGRSGEIVRDRFLLDELGDYLQNVAAVTPLLGPPEPLEWATALVRRAAGPRFRRGGLFESFAFHRRRWRRALGLGLASPYWNLDTLTGLVALYEIVRDQDRRDRAEWLRLETGQLARSLLQGRARDGRLRYGFHPRTGLTLPLSSPQLTGYVAEELIRFGRLAGDPWCLEAAVSLLRTECGGDWFERHGIFCADVHSRAAPVLRWALGLAGKRHFFHPLLMKDNTLPAFALLALMEAAPEHRSWACAAVERWRAAVETWFRTPSGYFSAYARASDGSTPTLRLTFNHSMIEWDIEAYVTTGAAGFLERAADLARRWVALQTERGLFPESPAGPGRARALLDSQVDLSMNLLKLAELTADAGWGRAALQNLEGVRRDFRLPAGYAWEVDSEGGEIREPRIEVKYLGLLLKGFLGFRAFVRGQSLRTSPFLWMLLRDR